MKPKRFFTPRLALVGTRVVVMRANAADSPGLIKEVRREPFLKAYVVALDDQTLAYCSQHELALEGDQSRTPLAMVAEY
jgi:hypothetical protein